MDSITILVDVIEIVSILEFLPNFYWYLDLWFGIFSMIADTTCVRQTDSYYSKCVNLTEIIPNHRLNWISGPVLKQWLGFVLTQLQIWNLQLVSKIKSLSFDPRKETGPYWRSCVSRPNTRYTSTTSCGTKFSAIGNMKYWPIMGAVIGAK